MAGCEACKAIGLVFVIYGVGLVLDAADMVKTPEFPLTGLPDLLQGIVGTIAAAGGVWSVWYNFFRKE